jgi:hypothetical protein
VHATYFSFMMLQLLSMIVITVIIVHSTVNLVLNLNKTTLLEAHPYKCNIKLFENWLYWINILFILWFILTKFLHLHWPCSGVWETHSWMVFYKGPLKGPKEILRSSCGNCLAWPRKPWDSILNSTDHVESEEFWRWYRTLRITGFLNCTHHPEI